MGRPAIAFVRLVPERVATVLGSQVASLLYFLLRGRREIGKENLATAFPKLPAGARRRILRQSYKNLGCTVVEILRLSGLKNEAVQARVCYAPGSLTNLRRALRRGKGAILFTGHLGNWELLALAHSLYGHPMHIVVRPLNNPLFNRAVRDLRTRGGNRILDRRGEGTIRELIDHLREGGMVGLLVDHCPRRALGIWAPFFGKLTLCHRGPALLALRTGAALVPGFLKHDDKNQGKLAIHFGPEIEVKRTGQSRDDVRSLTARLQEVVEAEIRSRPAEWLWMHRRWKGCPVDVPSGEECGVESS